MSDPLDDLRAELSAVTPSAGFEHRTIARIAREKNKQKTGARWGMRKWGSLAAAAAVIAAVAAGFTIKRPQVVAVSAPQIAATQSPVTMPVVHSDAAAPAAINAQAPTRARVSRAAIVIPQAAHRDQNIAVRRLMQLARVGTFAAPPNTAANALPALDESGPVPIPVPIEIAPITIAPLVPSGAAGRGGNE